MNKTLTIVTQDRTPVAKINWSPPENLEVEIINPNCEKELTTLLNRVRTHGVLWRTGGSNEEARWDEQITIGVNDSRFLSAFADVIGHLKFDNQRVFGLIK